MPHLLPPVLSPWVQAGWGGSLSPTRNPGSLSRGARLQVQPALRQERGRGGVSAVSGPGGCCRPCLLAACLASWTPTRDPIRACLAGLGFRPCRQHLLHAA